MLSGGQAGGGRMANEPRAGVTRHKIREVRQLGMDGCSIDDAALQEFQDMKTNKCVIASIYCPPALTTPPDSCPVLYRRDYIMFIPCIHTGRIAPVIHHATVFLSDFIRVMY